MNNFAEFEKRMNEIDCLIGLIPPKPNSENVEQINTLCRASIVLLSSHLEGFLQDMMEEFIDEVNHLSIGFQSLPVELYLQNNFPKGQIIQNNFNTLTQIFTEVKILQASNSSIDLDKSKFSKTNGNPTPDIINKLFKILGIDNVLDILNHDIKNLNTEESYKSFFTEAEKRELISQLGCPIIINKIEQFIVLKRNLKNGKNRDVGFYNTINQLLNYRNNIAHGNVRINISVQELIGIKDDIYCLVENLYIKADERINSLKELSITMAEVASEKEYNILQLNL